MSFISSAYNYFAKSHANAPDGIASPHPGSVPSQPIVWPADRQKTNQIQQTKGSAKPQTLSVRPTTQPNQSSVAPRTTPRPASHVRIVSGPPINGQKTIRVQFTHPAGDPYFAGANIYLRKGGSTQPVLVAGGAQSPLQFTVPVDAAPHVIHVTSFGNWGETDVLQSPAQRVRLK